MFNFFLTYKILYKCKIKKNKKTFWRCDCKSRSTSKLLVAYLVGDAQHKWRSMRLRDL